MIERKGLCNRIFLEPIIFDPSSSSLLDFSANSSESWHHSEAKISNIEPHHNREHDTDFSPFSMYQSVQQIESSNRSQDYIRQEVINFIQFINQIVLSVKFFQKQSEGIARVAQLKHKIGQVSQLDIVSSNTDIDHPNTYTMVDDLRLTMEVVVDSEDQMCKVSHGTYYKSINLPVVMGWSKVKSDLGIFEKVDCKNDELLGKDKNFHFEAV